MINTSVVEEVSLVGSFSAIDCQDGRGGGELVYLCGGGQPPGLQRRDTEIDHVVFAKRVAAEPSRRVSV